MKDEETMPTSQGMLNSETTQHKNLIPVLICLALAILTVITFWSLKDCGFINLDDNTYVYENAYVQSGLNWNNIDWRNSITLLDHTLKVTNYNWPLYICRSAAYNAFGNYRQAIDDYGRAIKIKPGLAEAYSNRGVAYARLGNINLAVNDLKTAAKLGHERAKNFLRSQGISW